MTSLQLKGFIFSIMHFPQEIYSWLVSTAIISNTGELDEKGNVSLPPNVSNNFDNGFLVGQIIRKQCSSAGKKVPNALSTVKSDNSKNTKLTNWNFIWLAFDAIGLKMDARIKELILQGEQALIVEVVRQLYERDQDKYTHNKVNIRMKSAMRAKGNTQAVDIKKINLSKDPEQSQTSLEFLMLLLKTSLGMNLEEILGLFTNQNKYLAHIIVKGVNENFDSIILFYSLLNKHAEKLKLFYEQDSRDAQACLYALKPGFISKDQKVAELTIELFGKLGNIYLWFTGEQSKCSGTLLLGLKRHPSLRQLYWTLLLQIIEGEEIQFFTKCYAESFQNQQQLIQITTFIIKFISESILNEKLNSIGIISSLLQRATKLPEVNVEAQIICFRFIGQLMFYIPQVIEQNQESLQVFERKWYNKTLPEFVALFNQMIVILERLGQESNNMASKIYQSIVLVAKNIGGDKRDYLVENFLPLLTKFPTIPSEYLIKHLKRVPLSSSEYLLVCQSIQINKNVDTLVGIGHFLKAIYIQNPLLSYYLGNLLKEIIQKIIDDNESGVPFFQKLLEDVLQLYGNLQLKYKPKPKQQQSLYFGKKGSPEKINKQQEEQLIIKQKWKQIILSFVMSILQMLISEQNEDMKEIVKQKLMDSNSYIRLNNHKVGSKPLEDILLKKFGISKQEQVEHSQEFNKKASAEAGEAVLQRSKAYSQSSLASKLKGPENLTKQFQLIVQKRKQQEEQKKMLQLKKQIIQQKKKLNAKKELQISNLLRGQIGQAQIRQLGFLERLVQEPRSLEVIPLEELEAREVQAIESIFKKYHKVLRHLFLTYTWTMYNSHSNQRFEDNQQRKETLNAVQLGKLLKDYRLAFLTNQPELGALVRDVNVKLLNKREVMQLDFVGFQQFIIQFCALIMTRNYSLTSNHSDRQLTFHHLRKQPLHIIVKQFFTHLKNVFIARGQKLSVFDDVSDITLTKEQAYQISIFTRKLQAHPNYILPKGYKKLSYNTVQFHHRISDTIGWIPQPYIIAVEILDSILSQPPFNTHIIQDIAYKKTVHQIKPTNLGERAMSTFIQRKSAKSEEQDTFLKRSSSRGVILSSQKTPSQAKLGESAQIKGDPVKDKAKQKKIISLNKLLELEKSRFEKQQKKAKEKEQQRLQKQKKEKEEERKKRYQMQKYIEQQKARAGQRQKKEAEQRQKKVKQHYDQQALKKQKKEQFKSFHQAQLQKIKKISEEALERARKEKQIEQQQRYRQDQLKRRLRQKIQQQDKKVVQKQKQAQKNINNLYQSQPIKRVFAKFNPNLKVLYQFLIQNTFLSLTQRKHNNQIIFDTWKYFLTVFELSIILHPKDISFIFKNLTKDKHISKQYIIGLNFAQFQQALLRIAIKYKVIFNIVAEKIKDNIKQPEKILPQEGKKEKEGKKVKKSKQEDKLKQKNEKDQNEFDNTKDINIKDILKQNGHSRDSIQQFGDTSKVTDRTLIGLIYYLKVPNSKAGQERRFRDILAMKPTFSHHSQRLKQKLNEQYTLESPEKKATIVKPVQKVPMPQKLK